MEIRWCISMYLQLAGVLWARFHFKLTSKSNCTLYRSYNVCTNNNSIVRKKTITQTYPLFTGIHFSVSKSSSKTMIEPISEYHAIMSSTKTRRSLALSLQLSLSHCLSLSLPLSCFSHIFPFCPKYETGMLLGVVDLSVCVYVCVWWHTVV